MILINYQNAGFDWIALKVIFQGRKGIHLHLFSNVDTYCLFTQNLFCNFFLYFGMKVPQDGANELWSDGFGWSTLKVILKVGKVRLGSFSHILSNFDTYCPFIQNLFCNLSCILAWSFPRIVTTKCEEKDLIESL